jgi:hypothetical protein
MLTNEGTGF